MPFVMTKDQITTNDELQPVVIPLCYGSSNVRTYELLVIDNKSHKDSEDLGGNPTDVEH